MTLVGVNVLCVSGRCECAVCVTVCVGVFGCAVGVFGVGGFGGCVSGGCECAVCVCLVCMSMLCVWCV